MPVYEYRCETRGHVFELKRSIDERDGRAVCPGCNSQGKRITSAFASSNGGSMQVPAARILRAEGASTRRPRAPRAA